MRNHKNRYEEKIRKKKFIYVYEDVREVDDDVEFDPHSYPGLKHQKKQKKREVPFHDDGRIDVENEDVYVQP